MLTGKLEDPLSNTQCGLSFIAMGIRGQYPHTRIDFIWGYPGGGIRMVNAIRGIASGCVTISVLEIIILVLI